MSTPPSGPQIVINGRALNPAQAMTVRCALQNFTTDLSAEGLGDDETGKVICAGYLRCLGEINRIIVHSDHGANHETKVAQ